jgi:multisubunit Na+/H+ antiporter MnhB subunit
VSLYRLLADAVLLVHGLFVAFVVFGQLLILIGLWRRWHWVRSWRFRLAHLTAIGIVVLQAWFGVLCPLTVLENSLRHRAGEVGYAGSFIQHWLHRIIFYDAESWVFTVTYTVFAMVVALTWYFGRPQRLP